MRLYRHLCCPISSKENAVLQFFYNFSDPMKSLPPFFPLQVVGRKETRVHFNFILFNGLDCLVNSVPVGKTRSLGFLLPSPCFSPKGHDRASLHCGKEVRGRDSTQMFRLCSAWGSVAEGMREADPDPPLLPSPVPCLGLYPSGGTQRHLLDWWLL